jgi:hypothetical protein
MQLIKRREWAGDGRRLSQGIGEMKRKDRELKGLALLLIGLLTLTYYAEAVVANPLDVVINEIAWMGTQADANDEWIELYNSTDQAIDLTGWSLVSTTDNSPSITLSSTIPAKGFFLLERTDDITVNDITADQIYTGSLVNTGEVLVLKDPVGHLVDTANGDGGAWPAGVNPTDDPDNWGTMERIDPLAPDSDDNWCTNDGVHRNGSDKNGNSINGTPKARNSCTNQPPVADAGPDQTVDIGDTVRLDGSGSSDSDGDPLSYSWSFISRPVGSEAALSDPNIVNPIFVADVAGDYVLELAVDDGRGGTDSDQMKVTAISKGDVNDDCKIDIQDAILAAKFALGLLTPNENQRKAADVVPPCGTTDVRDVVRIAEVALGIKDESIFTCNGGSGQDMGMATRSSAHRSGTTQLYISSKQILPSERVVINISSSSALEGLQVGPEGGLSFDPEVIQVKVIRSITPF